MRAASLHQAELQGYGDSLRAPTPYTNKGKLLGGPQLPTGWSTVQQGKPTEISSGTSLLTGSRAVHRDLPGLMSDSGTEGPLELGFYD